ncbi:MAG: lipopolysaccharide biosynthesis protein [Calditrichia bacterium]
MLHNLKDMLLRNQEHSLKLQSIRAAVWTGLGKGGGSFLRLVSSLILTRLLFPEVFGLMATASVILAMVQLFSDTGIRTAIIQNPRGDEPAYLNTSFIISILRSLLLFFVVAMLIDPLSVFYNQPELKPLLLFMAFSILLDGIKNPALPLVIKRLEADKQVSYELGTQFLGFMTTILFAFTLRSVWALAWGAVLTSFYRFIFSYVVERYKPRLAWDRDAGKELFHFGKFIFLNTLITWATMNMDRLILGKYLGMETLGYYNIGLNIGLLIEVLIVQIFAQSLFPAISKVAGDKERVIRIFRRSNSLLLTVATPVLVTQALFATTLVDILYDPRYATAAVALMWIAFRGVPRTIGIIQGGTFVAVGKPAYETIAMAGGLIMLLVLLPHAASKWGLFGACVTVFSSGVLISLLQSLLMWKKLGYPLAEIIRPWLHVGFLSALIFSCFFVLEPILSSELYGNLPFMMVMAGIAAGLSLLVYLNIEGTQPFKDTGLQRNGFSSVKTEGNEL